MAFFIYLFICISPSLVVEECSYDLKTGLLQCVLYGTALENYLEVSTGAERGGASSYWHQLLDACDITVPGAFGVLPGVIQSARCHF